MTNDMDVKISELLEYTKNAIKSIEVGDYESFHNSLNKRTEVYEEIYEMHNKRVFEVNSEDAKKVVKLDEELRHLMHNRFDKISEAITKLKMEMNSVEKDSEKLKKFFYHDSNIGSNLDSEV